MIRFSIVMFAALAVLTASTTAQVRPIYDRGAAGLDLLLGRLQTTASVPHTGAHPDDEDSALIARVARGDYARVAYLSLNRGEGGQNIIGPELFEALGVIRTEELLQARRLDGGEQFFTRTMDYGFSKARSEAAAKWGERVVLGDMVRIIRQYRPLVMFSRFSGTPADGHGHHQLAGHLTPFAFRAAADPNEFPEQLAEGLRPWSVRKLYVGQGFRGDGPAPTTRIATGTLNAAVGRGYAAIAAEGRSQHKSQEMGAIELLGPQSSALWLTQNLSASTGRDEASLFDGLDVSIGGLAAIAGLPAGALRAELLAIRTAAADASSSYDARQPSGIVPMLARGLTSVRAARQANAALAAPAAAKADADFLLAFKEHDFAEALTMAAAVTIDPLADAETVTPGDALTITVRGFVGDRSPVTLGPAAVTAPAGWTVTAAAPRATNDASPFARFMRETPARSETFTATVPRTAPYTQPYWLTQPRDGDLFHWPDDAPKGQPFGPALLSARVPVSVGGVTFELTRPVEFRYADRVRGELRRAVQVVPSVAVGVSSRLLVVPTATPATQTITVNTTSYAREPIAGVVRLTMPSGWSAKPEEVTIALKPGERTAASFAISPPNPVVPGTFSIAAQAVVGGQALSQDMQTIAYPHIQTQRLYSPATVTVRAIDLTVAQVRVGYIMGSGDQVPDAIRRMGIPVEMIDTQLLSSGDLSRFDAIVVGIRASQARPDFVANQGRLREYMERGGTLIVQYQQGDYTERQLAPLTGEIGARVTDETAAVTILQPGHPRFTFPNAIAAADFDGWVQERNLYSFLEFDKGYTPLLESGDPGEAPNRGGELYAKIGQGRYVYTSYAWFRQLPAGVPGAYRLFANLLSLSKAPS